MPRPAAARPEATPDPGGPRAMPEATPPAETGEGRAADAAPDLSACSEGGRAPLGGIDPPRAASAPGAPPAGGDRSESGPDASPSIEGDGSASAPAPSTGASTAPRPDGDAPPSDPSDAARPPRIGVLKKRREFLAAASALRRNLTGLNLQARRRRPEEPAEAPIRVGFTCSKKVGNAVARNRAKRRLRAAAAEALPRHGRPGWDYVLIGKRGATAERDFRALVADLEAGLAELHAKAGDRRATGAPVPRKAGRGRGQDRKAETRGAASRDAPATADRPGATAGKGAAPRDAASANPHRDSAAKARSTPETAAPGGKATDGET